MPETIQKKILSIRNERDWAQFLGPKNLAEALSIEAAELLETSCGRSPSSPPQTLA